MPAQTPGAAPPAAPGTAIAVLDTNAWLDLYVFDDAPARELRAALEAGRLQAVRSGRTDAELEAVLERPALAARSPAAATALRLAAWRGAARCIDEAALRPAPWLCRDRDDQKFLDLAVAARAAWLITKDRALLELDRRTRHAGLRVATPAQYARGAGA